MGGPSFYLSFFQFEQHLGKGSKLKTLFPPETYRSQA
jgi:hypothetical protein